MTENKCSMSKDQQIVQGDVFLKPINLDVRIEQWKVKDNFTLALGEATGHHHTITEIPKGMDVKLYEDTQGTLYLKVRGNDTVGLTHQEHDKVDIPAGDYEVGIVQEFDPFAEEARRVQD